MPGDGPSQACDALMSASPAVEGQLRSFLAVWLEEDENAARSAGHGFGHQAVGAPLNADWTELDGRENLRLSYDVHLVREFSPTAYSSSARPSATSSERSVASRVRRSSSAPLRRPTVTGPASARGTPTSSAASEAAP